MTKNRKFSLHIEDFLELSNHVNVYWTDADNRFIAANQNLLDMFHRFTKFASADDLLNKPLTEILPPQWVEAVYSENNKVMETGKVHKFLNKATFQNSKNLVFLTVKAPLYDEHGNISGVFGMSHIIANYNIEGMEYEPLTPREIDCLTLLIKGKTAAQIAKTLKLSTRTIEFYLSNIKNKFHCESKSDLIDKAHELGLSTLTTEATSEPFKTGLFIPNDHEK